jgi:glutamate dehydrogenase (NAD(P)+)
MFPRRRWRGTPYFRPFTTPCMDADNRRLVAQRGPSPLAGTPGQEDARAVNNEIGGLDRSWPFLADKLGPARVVLIHDPATGLEAIVVIDNVTIGPAIGGVRMAPDVSVLEVARLARAMTLKNAAAGLPHGGGKSGIVADPRVPAERKEALVRSFARAVSQLDDYIPGPDMGTDETCMAWVYDENRRCIGLPEVLGGIPLDQIGATGFGIAMAAEAVAETGRIDLSRSRVVVQGFGSVGKHASRFLAERGATIVAVADSGGAVQDPDGLELEKLEAWTLDSNSVGTFPDAEPIEADELVAVDCEIWIPAARPDVLTSDNAGRLRASVVLEGANIPTTAQAQEILERRGVLVIPDIIANAGGVICGSIEYHGGTRSQAFDYISEKIHQNTTAVVTRAASKGISPRAAAETLALERLDEAARYRRRI